MECAEVQAALPAYVGEPGSSLALRRHLSRCPECKAEFEAYESMLGGLVELRQVGAEVPRGLVASLVAIPASSSAAELAKKHITNNRRAYASGLAIAAAGATAALVWRRRRMALA